MLDLALALILQSSLEPARPDSSSMIACAFQVLGKINRNSSSEESVPLQMPGATQAQASLSAYRISDIARQLSRNSTGTIRIPTTSVHSAVATISSSVTSSLQAPMFAARSEIRSSDAVARNVSTHSEASSAYDDENDTVPPFSISIDVEMDSFHALCKVRISVAYELLARCTQGSS